MNLDDLERLAKEATPGPWRQTGKRERLEGEIHGMRTGDGSAILAEHRADAAFISAANPTVVLELVRRLRAAEAGNAECARDLCGHRLADHGEACGVGVEGEMGWIICGCQEFVK